MVGWVRSGRRVLVSRQQCLVSYARRIDWRGANKHVIHKLYFPLTEAQTTCYYGRGGWRLRMGKKKSRNACGMTRRQTGCSARAQVVDNWRRLDEWALFSGITLHASVRPISHWAVLCLCPGQSNWLFVRRYLSTRVLMVDFSLHMANCCNTN